MNRLDFVSWKPRKRKVEEIVEVEKKEVPELRLPILIVSYNYDEAGLWTMNRHIPTNEWRYVRKRHDIQGRRRADYIDLIQENNDNPTEHYFELIEELRRYGGSRITPEAFDELYFKLKHPELIVNFSDRESSSSLHSFINDIRRHR